MGLPFMQQRQHSRFPVLISPEFGRRLSLAAVTFLLLTLLVSLQWVPRQLQLTVGQPAPRKITAHKTVKYEEEEKTEQLRANVAELVEPVYDPDISVLQESLESLETAFERADRVRNASLTREEKLEQLGLDLQLPLPVDIQAAMLDLSEE